MRRTNDGLTWRSALAALVCIAATIVAACAGGDGGYTSMEYGYGGGVYYASAWNDPWYGGGPIYVGPPAGARPPGAIGGGPPHVSNLPAPMPAPRPAAGVGGGGGGRRR